MTTKEIRVMLQDIYLLGEAIETKLSNLLDRESGNIRGTLENDMLRYLIHLAAVDGKMTYEKWKVIEEFTDVNLAEAVDDAVFEDAHDYYYHDYYGSMEDSEIPVSLQIFKLAEDVVFGDQTGSMVERLIDTYEKLGFEFRERVADQRCFILERHEKFIKMLKTS